MWDRELSAFVLTLLSFKLTTNIYDLQVEELEDICTPASEPSEHAVQRPDWWNRKSHFRSQNSYETNILQMPHGNFATRFVERKQSSVIMTFTISSHVLETLT